MAVGCFDGSGESDPVQRTPSTSSAPRDPASVTLFDVVAGTDVFREQADVYLKAQRRAALVCARRHGLTVTLVPDQPQPESYLPDLDDRRRNGYHLSDLPSPRPVTGVGDQLTTEAILYGAPDESIPFDQGAMQGTMQVGGCNGESFRQVAGTVEAWNDLTNNRLRFVNGAIAFESEPDRAAASEKWAACMQARGYDYGLSPDEHGAQPEARADLTRRYRAPDADPEALRPLEIATAVDDGECIVEAGFATVMKKNAVDAYLAQIPSWERQKLEQIAADHTSAYQRAAALLPELSEELGAK